MAKRWSLGPVFAFEWLTQSRRWQAYALRSLFVAALLVGLAMVWQSATDNTNLSATQQLAQAGHEFFGTLTPLQLSLVLLAAPAATAGAISLDRARGSLAHVMVTDLTDAEVVLGKLAARLVPVLNLAACALPVAALGSLLGGIDPMALTGAFLIAAGVAVLGCSLAMVLSVWVAKTHEVMTVVFATWAVWLLPLPMIWIAANGGRVPFLVKVSNSSWLRVSNPFWLTMAPYNNPGTTSLREPVLFATACLLISAGLTALAVAKVRSVCLGQADRVPKPIKVSRFARMARREVRWWRGPSLDGNPVLWREWHRSRPSRWTRAVWRIYATLSTVASLWIIVEIRTDPGWGRGDVLFSAIAIQGVFGLLLVSASAATVLAEERVRGSLDVLLSTPLKTRSILWGKWWGAFRRVPWLAVWPAAIMYAMIPAKATTWQVGLAYAVPILILGQGAALASLGLALATWISRLGRAVTWTIAAFVASVIGWPILGSLLMSNSNGPPGGSARDLVAMTLFFGSPFFNIVMPAAWMSRQPVPTGFMAGIITWAIAYPLIAAGLYLATLLSFDRCLGRSPEGPRKPRADPGAKGAGPAVRGWGWRIPGAGGRPAVDAASFGPRPR